MLIDLKQRLPALAPNFDGQTAAMKNDVRQLGGVLQRAGSTATDPATSVMHKNAQFLSGGDAFKDEVVETGLKIVDR